MSDPYRTLADNPTYPADPRDVDDKVLATLNDFRAFTRLICRTCGEPIPTVSLTGDRDIEVRFGKPVALSFTHALATALKLRAIIGVTITIVTEGPENMRP